VGKLPFVQTGEDLGMVRLFDMPIEMESLWYAFGWPYHHNDQQGEYRFRAEGQACDALRFAKKEGAMNSGSWNQVLGSEPNEGAWLAWDDLVEASRSAVLEGTVGEFQVVTGKLPGLEKHLIPFRNF
jgi:hypothetical protein